MQIRYGYDNVKVKLGADPENRSYSSSGLGGEPVVKEGRGRKVMFERLRCRT